MKLINPDTIRELTSSNPFDRFPDGRPKVPDDLLRRMEKVTTEEAWGVIGGHGYKHQFEGDWINLRPDRILVGRAVTGRYIPTRPDLNEVIQKEGEENNRIGGQNSWVIDTLVEGDVIVIELFGKIVRGTFVGDNLSTAVAANTGGRGMVIDGGIRDYQRIAEIENLTGFVKGLHPTAIGEVTLTEINGPVRIGEATALPGDIVLGTPTGVLFIPPHLVEEVLERSEDIRFRDYWGKSQIAEGKYTPGEIDRKWEDHIEAAFTEWSNTHSLDDIDV